MTTQIIAFCISAVLLVVMTIYRYTNIFSNFKNLPLVAIKMDKTISITYMVIEYMFGYTLSVMLLYSIISNYWIIYIFSFFIGDMFLVFIEYFSCLFNYDKYQHESNVQQFMNSRFIEPKENNKSDSYEYTICNYTYKEKYVNGGFVIDNIIDNQHVSIKLIIIITFTNIETNSEILLPATSVVMAPAKFKYGYDNLAEIKINAPVTVEYLDVNDGYYVIKLK